METLKEWLTPRELEKEYSMSIGNQAKLRMNKKIPHSKIGKYIRYNRDEINNWLKMHEVKTLDGVAS